MKIREVGKILKDLVKNLSASGRKDLVAWFAFEGGESLVRAVGRRRRGAAYPRGRADCMYINQLRGVSHVPKWRGQG